MRIVSLNAWGGALFDELRDWLPGAQPDVLGIQEATSVPGAVGWTDFGDGERHFPQRANLVDDLAEVLPDHRALFLASDTGPVVDADGHERRQHFGLGTFIADRLPIVGMAAGFVHDRHRSHEVWPTSGRPRIAHGCRVVDDTTGRIVTIVHLHGLRDVAGKGDSPARDEQARRLVRLIEELREPDDLTVVCGDLNLLPDSRTFDALGEIGLVDLVGDADTRTSRYTKPFRHANYLLVSDPAAVRSFEMPAHPEVSDHRPLILDI